MPGDPIIRTATIAEAAANAHRLRFDLCGYINGICDRLGKIEPELQTLLPEPNRRERLLREADALLARFPDPAKRPPLFGILVGVKDIFRVDGFVTRCGSALPPELFAGPEAECVTKLRKAGALILGKTVTTEFAYFEPGPTRNPHNLAHTPGGSSSGSAAAVAAGLCPLALGTQTVGSVLRPSAYCGVVGFKPSFGRISTAGVIPFAESADHIGLFTQDVEGMSAAAAVLWADRNVVAPVPGRSHRNVVASVPGRSDGAGPPGTAAATFRPVLGVTEGPYLAQASAEAREVFESQLRRLQAAGYVVKRIPMFAEIADISRRHWRMCGAEMAMVHREWFTEHERLYRFRTAKLIREGQGVGHEELAHCRESRLRLRAQLETLMNEHDIGLWLCPSATGPAPHGINSTGDPAMNLPWTHAGMPALTLPAGRAKNGLPLGLQLVAPFGEDERLLASARDIEAVVNPQGDSSGQQETGLH
jgi:Asp-tRNA(Asn)/Glu-tRNA(Gln) amidotransferase A subunit family amidase